MLGIARFVLAIVLVANHLWAPVDNRIGASVMSAFYMISGYLITKVLYETYGFDASGTARFLVNRVLRVFPAYWLFLGLTLLMLMLFGERFAVIPQIGWPQSTEDWLRNVTLVDLTWGEAILIPPAWALGVEVLFYILMPLALARSAAAITAWFVASVVVAVVLVAIDAPFGYRYHPAYAASLFVSAGAMLYLYRERLGWMRLPWGALAPMLAAFIAFPVLIAAAGLDPLTLGYYGAALAFAPILITLMLEVRQPSAVDRWLGDLAMPVFVGHFLAAGIVKLMMEDGAPTHGTAFFLAALALTLVISALFVALIDAPLQRLRARVRHAPAPGVASDDNPTRPVRVG
jgi:peptidoglycan/LPS O-acetylase OafA/YrhL